MQLINTNKDQKHKYWYRYPKRPELEDTDGGNVGTDVISPREVASDDKSDEPPVLPSNPPLSGKLLAYQQILELKNNKKKRKRKKEKKKRKEEKKKKKSKRIHDKLLPYCKEQDWKFAI